MTDHEEIRGCIILKDLYYAVGDHTWLRINEDNTVTVGMTDVAQNMAGPILHARVKKIGTMRKKGKPLGTVESSKWVGPVKSPVNGEIIEVNQQLQNDPQLINLSPYKNGWIAKLKPHDLDTDIQEMLLGDEAVEAYRDKIEKEDIKGCQHIEGLQD